MIYKLQCITWNKSNSQLFVLLHVNCPGFSLRFPHMFPCACWGVSASGKGLWWLLVPLWTVLCAVCVNNRWSTAGGQLQAALFSIVQHCGLISPLPSTPSFFKECLCCLVCAVNDETVFMSGFWTELLFQKKVNFSLQQLVQSEDAAVN